MYEYPSEESNKAAACQNVSRTFSDVAWRMVKISPLRTSRLNSFNLTSLDLFTSMHPFIICAVSRLSCVNSLLCSKKQEESSPKTRELISYSPNVEISKMEDRLHVHQIRAKQWPNDRQYLIQTVHADTQNRREIRGWQSIDVNRHLQPRGGGQSPHSILRQRGIAVQMEVPGLVAEQETTLSHVHHRSFLKPHFLKANIYVTKYRQNFF
jgi:hypothetical protein